MQKPEQQMLSDKIKLHSRSWRHRNTLKRKERGTAQLHRKMSKRSPRSRRSLSLKPFESEDDKKGLECFAHDPDYFLGVALAEVCEHVEGHWNEPATIDDLALTTLRYLKLDVFATSPRSCIKCLSR